MKIVSIHQPHYLPWLGYFHRLQVSDVHVVLDHVQFEKNSFINRNKLRTPEGWCWITVPVRTKGRFEDLEINTLEIANKHDWTSDHWKTMKFNYANSEYFDQHKSFFKSIYNEEWSLLKPLNENTTKYLLRELSIDTQILSSSNMDLQGSKDKLVRNICKKTAADIYLSGPKGKDYIDDSLFHQEGIDVIYQNYNHPTYEQVFEKFEPKMSTVDLLFNNGPDSKEILMENNRTRKDLIEESTAQQ